MQRNLAILVLATASSALLAQYPNSQYPNSQYPNSQYPGPGYPNQGNQNPVQQQDDTPGQPVARIGIINGDASVMRGDSGEWTAAVVNAPLAAGDSISLPPGSRAELQLDNGNFVRIDGDTEIRIAAFDGAHAQIQVSRGVITWRSLRDSPLQVEISTPVVAVHPLRMSAVRIEAMPDDLTRVTVRHGDAETSTPRSTERVHEGNMVLVRGNGAQGDAANQMLLSAAPPDAWDGWNEQRDGYLSRAQSNRYVSPDVYGAEDLDAAGRWGYDPAYGNVWTPDVGPGWAPYRDGEWVWSDPYGWTWVDAAPWGWAPFHYGSWYFRAGFGWSWYPGSRFGHYWWHPAMVGFFGFGSNIGWVPLAPFERFHPWYGRGIGVGVGFGFGGGIGVVGAYRNAGFATGLAAADFQRGAFGNHFVVNRDQLVHATVVRGAIPVTPTAANRRFTGRTPIAAGPRNSFSNQSFYSRQAPGQGVAGSGLGRPAAPQAAASGWQRFGQTPARTPAGPGPQAGAGWDRFGSPARPSQQQAQPGGPAGGRSFAGGDARALQVAPPIVRQREAPPSYNRAPAPSYSRPSAPSYNRPPASGGRSSGGSHNGGGNGQRR